MSIRSMVGDAALRVPQGVPAILASVAGMALADAIIKQASGDISLWQVWILRSLLVIPVLFLMARGRVFVSGAGWIALRCLALIGMYLCGYSVLPFIDLALLGAAFYTAPLFIVGLSALVLGNRVRAYHWLAIFMGFSGLLIIVRSFGATFAPVALVPIGAAICYASAAVLTRARCASISAVVLGFWLNVGFLAVGVVSTSLLASVAIVPTMDFPFLFSVWHPMSVRDWVTMVILAVLMLGIAVGVAKAYQSPKPEVVAAFDYCYMVFAILSDLLFFGQTPDRWTLVGTSLIIASGLGVLRADASSRHASLPRGLPESS